jgi:histone arginine demethylase JMJD6
MRTASRRILDTLEAVPSSAHDEDPPKCAKTIVIRSRRIEKLMIQSGQPRIIPDAAKQWPARSCWSFDYLQAKIGHKPAIIGRMPVVVEGSTLSINEFIGLVTQAETKTTLPYLHAASIPTYYPELLPDIQPALDCMQPNFMNSELLPWQTFGYPEGKFGFPELLIGAPGTGIPELHYDIGFEHAFITQLIGDKELFLFPPSEGGKLYPRPGAANQSAITDVEQPDLQRYPLFREAQMQRLTVRQGETIFIPSGWWHISKSLTPGAAVSFNAVSASNWKAFMTNKLKQPRKPLKHAALHAYLTCAGICLKSLEGLTSRHREIY